MPTTESRVPRHRREVACVDAYPAVKERGRTGVHARHVDFHRVAQSLDADTRRILTQEAAFSVDWLRAFHEDTAGAMVQHTATMLEVRP